MNAHQRRLDAREGRPRCADCDRRVGESPCVAEDHPGRCCDCVDEISGVPGARIHPRLRAKVPA